MFHTGTLKQTFDTLEKTLLFEFWQRISKKCQIILGRDVNFLNYLLAVSWIRGQKELVIYDLGFWGYFDKTV